MIGNSTTESTMNSTTERISIDCGDEDHFKKNIPVVVMLSIFSVIGVLGNSLIIYVYGAHFKKTTTRVFILSLAVIDLITCAGLPYKLILLRYGHLFKNVHLARLEIVRLYFLQVSAMILPLISIDRYRRVCVPLKKQITPRTAKILVLIVIILMAAICSFRMAITYEEDTLCYRAEAFISQSYLNKDIQTSWVNSFYFVYVILPFITPVPILIIMYSLVGAKVRNLSSHATESRNSQSNRTFSSCGPRIRLWPKGKSRSDFRKKLYGQHQIGDTNDSSQNTLESPSEDVSTSEYVLQRRFDGTYKPASSSKDSTTATSASSLASAQTRQGNDNRGEYSQSVAPTASSTATLDTEEPSPGVSGETEWSPDIMSRLQRVTLIFFLITVVYIFSCIPFCVFFMVFRIDPDFGRHLLSGGVYIVFYDFVYITVVSNCFLYGFFDPRFRREVKMLYRRLKKIICCVSLDK